MNHFWPQLIGESLTQVDECLYLLHVYPVEESNSLDAHFQEYFYINVTTRGKCLLSITGKIFITLQQNLFLI